MFDTLELVSREKFHELSTSSESAEKANPSATIFILQSWTIGLLYLRLLLRILNHTIDPTSRPARAMRAITRNGILQADIWLATRGFILPVTTICMILLLFPLTYMRVVITIFRVTDAEKQ